jgi:hypothetical protein
LLDLAIFVLVLAGLKLFFGWKNLDHLQRGADGDPVISPC